MGTIIKSIFNKLNQDERNVLMARDPSLIEDIDPTKEDYQTYIIQTDHSMKYCLMFIINNKKLSDITIYNVFSKLYKSNKDYSIPINNLIFTKKSLEWDIQMIFKKDIPLGALPSNPVTGFPVP